jgi:hypothetical protein
MFVADFIGIIFQYFIHFVVVVYVYKQNIIILVVVLFVQGMFNGLQ